MTDILIFGNLQSESAHNLSGESRVVNGGRALLATNPPSRFSSEITFDIKVDPEKQNYFSLKLLSSEKYTPIYLYIDQKQLGYAKCSDYEALNLGYGNFKPEGSFFVTTPIPLWYTKGQCSISVSLRQAEPYDNLTEVCGTIYECYSTTSPTFDLSEYTVPVKPSCVNSYTKADDLALSESYISSQVEFFNRSLAKLKGGEKLSITKYVEEMRHFIMTLFEPYCPLNDKSEAVNLVLECINSYVKDYFENPRTLLHNAHQSDWGGYYGEIGQSLYLIEKLLDKESFKQYLSSPFNSFLTKKEAWEICLKANFDFASARQSYIYNQTYYTYEGAWKAMAGLGVIESKYYIGKEKCDLILKEALGIAPWKGEHILLDKSGRELDLYHCLFNHDRSARFTDDFINIVCTGEAVQALDENGNFIRRKPYGENYYPLTHRALTRENGYVGNYGETANYLPEWVYRTFVHGDYELSDLILKTALENINSRMCMRYQGYDENGSPIMLLEQAIDERNPTMTPKSAYGAIIHDKRSLLFASLKRHMTEHSERYSEPEWDKYKSYAAKALDAVRQQHADGHFLPYFSELLPNYNDFKIDRTIKDIFCDNITHYLPHSHSCDKNFVFFDIDNLLLSLREGDVHIFAQLNHRNRGYSGYGRAHIIQNGTHHLTQFATDGVFTPSGTFIRQQNVNMDFIYDSSGSNSFARAPEPLGEFGATPQALCGEEQMITYQKGIGKVLRENFEVDTPYSGYPDVIWAQIGNYFIACNTTRESYENARTYTLPFKINGEEITLAPFSYRVIKTGSIICPSSVKFINALTCQDGVLLSWKHSSGSNYNIYRDGTLICQTDKTVFTDTDTESGKKYSYTITAVSSNGESHMSPAVTAVASKCDYIREKIGNANEGIFFGTGDDYRANERNIKDALFITAKAVHGSNSVQSDKNVIARESLADNCRYAYMGFEGDKIVIRTRSKNTIYNPTGQKLSPLFLELDKKDFTLLKLIVEKDLHSVCLFASNGNKWQLLHREVLPLPQIYYIGSISDNSPVIAKEEYNKPFNIKSAFVDNGTIIINKGLDNKYLIVEASEDMVNFNVIKNDLIAHTYTPEELSSYYRITPVSRHGIKGESIIIKASSCEQVQ